VGFASSKIFVNVKIIAAATNAIPIPIKVPFWTNDLLKLG
jgi:hypothetical protein